MLAVKHLQYKNYDATDKKFIFFNITYNNYILKFTNNNLFNTIEVYHAP